MRLPGWAFYNYTNSFYLWWPLWWFPATKIVAWTTMKLKMNFQFFMLVAFGKKDSSWKKTFKTILKFLGLISNFHILFFLNTWTFFLSKSWIELKNRSFLTKEEKQGPLREQLLLFTSSSKTFLLQRPKKRTTGLRSFSSPIAKFG